MVEATLTPLHYQKQLLTQTIMEDEKGNSMLKSKEYLSHEFLKKAVFGVQNWDGLPVSAQRYLERLAEVTGVPIDIVSTGPDRDQTILLRHPFAD